MPRIRTTKPEFWSSEPISRLSTNARLLFLGSWNFCDDMGVHPLSYRRLRLEIFPADRISDGGVEKLFAEITNQNLVAIFTDDTSTTPKQYFVVRSWFEHQKIDRPSRKFPLAPAEEYTMVPGWFDEHSSSGRGPPDPGKGKGKGKGREGGKGNPPKPPLGEQGGVSQPDEKVSQRRKPRDAGPPSAGEFDLPTDTKQ